MGVRILLPPSEAKSPGGTGVPLAELGLGTGQLATTRRTVIDAVARLCADRPDDATDLLRLPPGVAEAARAANVAVWQAPTMPALDRFTGVLFDAFAPGSLPPAARARAEESVVVFDGSFGVLGGGDLVPDHRVPAAAMLPDLGGVAALWRPTLAAELPGRFAGHVVVDLRSTDYAAMWRPGPNDVLDVLTVRILVAQPGTSGHRSGERHAVMSVPSKVGKGLLARALCRTRRTVRSRRDVLAVARTVGFTPLPTTRGDQLDLVFDFVPKASR
ncbi:MAG: uncharacterized protein QOC98_493 [Frankiaceae bacterium]|nr:uncharacterized protein [Frankiaceae bacterium]